TIHKLHSGKILIIGGNFTTGNGASQFCILIGQDGLANCINTGLTLSTTSPQICSGKEATIKLSNSESGEEYQAYSGNNPIGNPMAGGSPLDIVLPASQLVKGDNIIKIEGKKDNCVSGFLTQSVSIKVNQEDISAPVVSFEGSERICPGDSVIIKA